MSGLLSPGHLILILLIVLVVFGTKKLRNIGSDLGGAVKNFKDAMNEETKPAMRDDSQVEVIEAEIIPKKTKQ